MNPFFILHNSYMCCGFLKRTSIVKLFMRCAGKQGGFKESEGRQQHHSPFLTSCSFWVKGPKIILAFTGSSNRIQKPASSRNRFRHRVCMDDDIHPYPEPPVWKLINQLIVSLYFSMTSKFFSFHSPVS